MERLLFAGNVALATTPATLAAVNATGIAEGAVALYDHEGAIISKALTKNLSISNVAITSILDSVL